MKTTNDYSSLSGRIAWGNNDLVQEILEKNKELDLMYDEGRFFILAIEHGHVDITKSLLNYFEENQLDRWPPDQQKLLKDEMHKWVARAAEGISLSDEMKKAIGKYVDFDEDSSRNDSFLDDISLLGDIDYQVDKIDPTMEENSRTKSNSTHPDSQIVTHPSINDFDAEEVHISGDHQEIKDC